MLKTKRTKATAMAVIAGLIILPLILGACDTASDSAETPFGLRSEGTDDVLENSAADSSEAAAPPFSQETDTSAAAEVKDQPELVQVAAETGGQFRAADRYDHVFDPTTAAELAADEIDGLVFMREEEKLARDVYLALYDQWAMPVFQNIASSEQAHMDALLILLEQYGISDPAAGKDLGEFSNPNFQSLYLLLVEQGRLSEGDGIKVGAAIEELDIMDLQERLAQTSNEYIIQVYTNLLAGSENHLRAFVSNPERQTGGVYQPIYLGQDAYNVIMSGASGQGSGGYRGGNGGSGNGSSGNRGGGAGGIGSAGGSGAGGNGIGRNGRGGGALRGGA